MSWSVGAAGKAPAVAAAIERQFKAMDSYPCPEPEETAKQLVRQAIAALLAGHSKTDSIVQVTASGSMGWAGTSSDPKDVTTSLNVGVVTTPILE